MRAARKRTPVFEGLPGNLLNQNIFQDVEVWGAVESYGQPKLQRKAAERIATQERTTGNILR